MNKLRSSGSIPSVNTSASVDLVEQFLDSLRLILNDTNQIISEYNKEVYTTLGTLPQGTSDTRWNLSDNTINPRINNLDGANIFVDTASTSVLDSGRFWKTANSRPYTIKETFNNLYTYLNTNLNSIRAEIATKVDNTKIESYNISATSSNIIESDTTKLVFDGTSVSATSIGVGTIKITAPAGNRGAGTYIYFGPYTYSQAAIPVTETVCQFPFDAGEVINSNLYFDAVVTPSLSVAGTTQIRLYDLGPVAGPFGVPRLVYTASTSSTSGIELLNQPLTVVDSGAGSKQVLSSRRIYEIQIYQSSAIGDTAYLGSAGLSMY